MKERCLSTKAGLFCALLAVALLSGCAVKNTLGPKVQAVEESITAARAVNADTYAAEAFKAAEDKLAEANKAIELKEFTRASRLLDEAMSDSELARVKAPAEKTRKEVTELRGSINKLREEITVLTAPKQQ